MSAITKPAPGPMALVPQADLDQMVKLDDASRAAHQQLIQAEQQGNDMAKGLIMARSLKVLRQLLTPALMADVMELQGNKLGFKTDRDSDGGYPVEVVRDVMVQGLLRGVRPVHNEINIIAGQLYITREGFERMLRQFPGLSNLQIEIGVPAMAGEGALVPARASWRLNGVQDILVCEKGSEADYRIPIRVNKGMGADAIQGKARSKLYRRIYERLTGTELLSVDDAEPITVDGSAQPAGDVPAR
jgi:hypothetical protein